MKINSLDEFNLNYTKLDYFLNRAFWDLKPKEEVLKNRKSVLLHVTKELTMKKMEYFISSETSLDLHVNKKFNREISIDFLIINKNHYSYFIQNIQKFFDNNFKMVDSKKDQVTLLIKNRLIVFRFSKVPFILNFKNKNINLDAKRFDYRVSNYEKFYFWGVSKTINLLTNKTVLKKVIYFFRKKNTYSYKYLSEKEFLNLKIESKKSINWLLRKPHLDIITNEASFYKIKNIVKYFKKENTKQKLIEKIVEVNLKSKLSEPIHLQTDFWLKGNNFYIYPILYGFKKDVVPYKECNSYIQKKSKFNLYSKDYFSSLQDMTDVEISNLFKNSPAEITGGAVTSGKHRMCAMIGRLSRSESYIPIYARVIE